MEIATNLSDEEEQTIIIEDHTGKTNHVIKTSPQRYSPRPSARGLPPPLDALSSPGGGRANQLPLTVETSQKVSAYIHVCIQ